jgi:integrase
MGRKRRSPGEGSVYRVGRRWLGAIAWTNPDGTRQRRVVAAPTAAEARAKLDEIRAALQAGVRPSTQTVADYLTSWLEAERLRVRPSSWRSREQFVRVHLIPRLGRIALARLTPLDVERMTADIIASGRSPTTAAGARTILRRALADAARDGLVIRNAAALARPPYRPTRTLTPGRDFLVPADLRRLLDVARVHPLGPLVTVAATTGLRLGELLGLRWADVDLRARTVTVRTALARRLDGSFGLAEPKSARSRRTIDLPKLALTALERQKDLQAAARERAGAAWQNAEGGEGLVFTDVAGRHLRPWDVNKAFHALLDAAGLPSIPFHGLRHSAATLMLAGGVPLKVVADTLGHSTVVVTADRYAGVIASLKREAAAAVDEALGG